MPLGMILLVITAILIYFGLAQRVLDRMRLTDRAALLFLAAILLGGLAPDIMLLRRPVELSINIGGGIVPIVLAWYLISRADTAAEKRRAVIAALVTAVVVYGAYKVIPNEPEGGMYLDPLYIFAGIAGVVGYLSGRSRRSAFIAGTVGLILANVFQFFELFLTAQAGRTVIGGAGIFDSIIIAGLLAVLIAEIVGESRERLTRQSGGLRPPDRSRDQEVAEEFGRLDDSGGEASGTAYRPVRGENEEGDER